MLVWLVSLAINHQAAAKPRLARAFESELRAKLAHVKYGSPEFKVVFDETRAHYQKGADTEERVVRWWQCFGPSPLQIAQVSLVAADRSAQAQEPLGAWYDDANIALWPTPRGTGVQFLDGFNEWTNNDPSFISDGEAYRDRDRLIRCGPATKAGNRSWPAARVYRLQDRRWRIVANKEVEHPFGFAYFRRNGHGVGANVVIAETRDEPRNFAEPMSGPFLHYRQSWTIGETQFRLGKVRLVETPLAELDRLAQLVLSNNKRAFDARVAPKFRKELWRLCMVSRQVDSATARDELRCDHFHFANDQDELHGSVRFAYRSGRWQVVAVGP